MLYVSEKMKTTKQNFYFLSYMVRKVTKTYLSGMQTFWYDISGCVPLRDRHVVASRHSQLPWLCSTFLDIGFPFSEYIDEIPHLALRLQLQGLNYITF